MNIESQLQNDGSLLLIIAEDMTIYTVAEQKQQLLCYLLAHENMQLDLSEVEEVDSAGLQLLMFLKKEASRLGKKLSLIHHSSPVLEVFELLNLGEQFGDPILIARDRK